MKNILFLVLVAAVATATAGCDRQPTTKELVQRAEAANTCSKVRTYKEIVEAQKTGEKCK
jgi:hypothetical protein